MELNKIYFYTATIEGWKHLLKDDRYKDIIIGSLRYLSEKELINVYAFCYHAQSYSYHLGNAADERQRNASCFIDEIYIASVLGRTA